MVRERIEERVFNPQQQCGSSVDGAVVGLKVDEVAATAGKIQMTDDTCGASWPGATEKSDGNKPGTTKKPIISHYTCCSSSMAGPWERNVFSARNSGSLSIYSLASPR